ncbi:transglycosylase SLT domain-containing protein [Azospirillum sp. YIM B02556]|uniref:Transglycosylase SLT domain-containing protein n=1 Tax=Azospirillum endophyticum TaxID=2800326 RepID=A0ABS1FG88_9PROT|nr:transglycosylase SLT domain-containing protein [Azospirillum endophyticum]MBK1842443.1 transglycosylase SLT domain-containing protein [Azospirillum endophyticum]
MANTFQIIVGAKDQASPVIGKVESRLGRLPGAVDTVSSSFERLGDSSSSWAKAERGISGVSSAVSDLARGFGVANSAGGLLGVMTVAGQAALVDHWGKVGVATANAASGIGIAAGRLRTLQGAAKLAGLSADDMTNSMAGMATTLQDAAYGRNREAAAMLSSLGITVRRAADGTWDLEHAFRSLSAVIARQKSPQTQALIAQTFKSEALLPMLRRGTDAWDAYIKEIERLGAVSEETQRNSEELGISLNKLHVAVDGFWVALEGRMNQRYGGAIDKVTDLTAANKENIASWADLTSQVGMAYSGLSAVAKLAGEGSIWGRLSLLARAGLASPWGIVAAGAYAAWATAPDANKKVVIRKETPEEKKEAEESWWPSWLPRIGIDTEKSPDATPSPNAADNQPPNWWPSWLPNLGIYWKGQGAVDKAASPAVPPISSSVVPSASSSVASSAGISDNVRRWDPQVTALSAKYGVDPDFVRRIMQQESGGRTHDRFGNPLTSSAGAIGPMQVMPGTYAEMARRYGIKGGITDPDANIEAGVAYLSEQMKRFGNEAAAAAAYNAGPGRVQQNIDSGKALPSETKNYVASIAAMQRQQPQAAGGGEQKVNVTVTLGGNVPEGTSATAQTGAGTAVPTRIDYSLPSFARP